MTIANLFELNSGSVNVTYVSTSRFGGRQFYYRDGTVHREFKEVDGDVIQVEESALGQIITVILETVPDLREVTFSIILPEVRLLPQSNGTQIDVPGLATTSHTTIAGPGMGPAKTYNVLTMHGTATFAQFASEPAQGIDVSDVVPVTMGAAKPESEPAQGIDVSDIVPLTRGAAKPESEPVQGVDVSDVVPVK